MTTPFVPGKLYRNTTNSTVCGHIDSGDTILLLHSERKSLFEEQLTVLNVLVLTSKGILHRMCFYNIREFQQLFSEVQP